MSVKNGRKRITVTFTDEEYASIKNIAYKEYTSMSDVVRNFCIQGINGNLTQDNLDFIVPIIREQLKSIIDPAVNRLAALSAKTCVQAGAAAYLSAEAILKFVPEERSEEVAVSYEAARKKAVQYMRNSFDVMAGEDLS